MRMMLAEGVCGEASELARTLRESHEDVPRAVITRYVLFMNEPCDDAKSAQLVDLVLLGAQNGGARRLKRAK